MLTAIANVHRHKLPRPGAIVTVRDRPLGIGRRYRRFIVESYPLSDAADQRYSRGIQTCTIRALDNGQRFRVSGIWCEEDLLSTQPFPPAHFGAGGFSFLTRRKCMTTFRIAVCGYEEGASDKESTHVELTVNHDKNRKIAYLYVGPLQIADGWETRRITFGGRSHLTLEAMPRLNRKRLDALLEQVKYQIADKTGPAWDLLEAVRAENGLILCPYTYQSKLIEVC